jgi:hypothetical protein
MMREGLVMVAKMPKEILIMVKVTEIAYFWGMVVIINMPNQVLICTRKGINATMIPLWENN